MTIRFNLVLFQALRMDAQVAWDGRLYITFWCLNRFGGDWRIDQWIGIYIRI